MFKKKHFLHFVGDVRLKSIASDNYGSALYFLAFWFSTMRSLTSNNVSNYRHFLLILTNKKQKESDIYLAAGLVAQPH